MAEWKKVGVNVDYHVEVDGHYYSVPYTLIRQELMARYTRAGVEFVSQVAARSRPCPKLPEGPAYDASGAHAARAQEVLDWTPERLVSWAGTIGPNCGEAARHLLASRSIPQHAFRPCLGLIRLGKRYGNERVDQACSRALRLNIVAYRYIESMLKKGRDRIPLALEEAPRPVVAHDNVRGSIYYQ